jgi:hypothetical protein
MRRSRYEGPTGIVGVLSDAFAKSNIPVGSMWGNVPHYISASPNPKVVHALLARLSTLYGLGLELSEMERAGRRFERQVNEALIHNREVAEYVKRLEERIEEPEPGTEEVDDEPPAGGAGELPRGEDVVRQLEEFLRERSSNPDDAPDDDAPADEPPKN